MSPSVFTDAEIDYLRSQRLGRLATLTPAGTLQNSPVGFTVRPELGVIDIAGWNMGASRKFRNVAANGQLAFVVDDIVSVNPWTVRCLEIRGTGEALSGPESPEPGSEIIRVHPRRIISWGLGEDGKQGSRRTIEPGPGQGTQP
jgi:pyridoxamine 5'-phosphate oxidase family protein